MSPVLERGDKSNTIDKMRVIIPIDRVILASVVLMLLDVAFVHLIYRIKRYRGFIPTLSEAALTDIGGKIYAFLTPLSGTIIFSVIPIMLEELLPDTSVSKIHLLIMKILCLFSYLCLCYQAIVPFNKTRKLDSHTIMAGLFMLGSMFIVSFYTYLGWVELEVEKRRKNVCLAIRVFAFILMAYCIINIIPFMFGVLKSGHFKEAKIILRHDTKLLTKMGLLQLTATMTIPVFLLSLYWESKGLYISVINEKQKK